MPPKTQMMSADETTFQAAERATGFSDSAVVTHEQAKLSAVLGAVETAKSAASAPEQAAKVAEHATQRVSEKMATSAQAAGEHAKEQLEALMQAGSAVAKGAEEVSREMTTYVQNTMAGAAAMTKALMSAHTLKDLMEIQSEYLKTSFDSMVSNTSKLSEIGVRVATEAWSPIAHRVQQGVEKMVRPAL